MGAWQCDQMAWFIFQNLAIYNSENLPNSIRKLPKYVQHFDKYLMNPLKVAKVV